MTLTSFGMFSTVSGVEIRDSEGEMAVQRRLVGKRALIYGGGTGIGFACAEAFAREGASVFVSSRRDEVLREAWTG